MILDYYKIYLYIIIMAKSRSSKKGLKGLKGLNGLWQSPIILYILAAIAVINILWYLIEDQLSNLVLFLLVGLGTSFVTKNMIIILLATIIVTNIIVRWGLLKKNSFYEGLESKQKKPKKGKAVVEESDSDDSEAPEGAVHSPSLKKKDKHKFSNITDSPVLKPKLNKEETMSTASDQLNRLIGSSGVKSMTNDTEGLLNKQGQIMDQLKSLEPMMANATTMMNTLDKSGWLNSGKFLGKFLGNKDENKDSNE
jgi:hypothetical protein